ncbi:serine/threonine-protein kinase [Luedemannella flava]
MTGVDHVIAGRYRLVSRLGAGGMGTVWQAHDERLRRDVAVKHIVFPATSSGTEQQRLAALAMAEARHAASLAHPHIVAVHDVIEEDAQVYIVMQLVVGQTLEQVVRGGGPLPPARVATIGLALLDALSAAHEAGVLHRDVKPSNVLISQAGTVLLTDFSISRAVGVGTMTRSSILMGTPGFIAPERFTDGISGPEGDLFGLGATLYFAVQGKPPFYSEDGLANLFASASRAHAPADRAGDLAPALDGLLAKSPAERWSGARARPRWRPSADPRPSARPRRPWWTRHRSCCGPRPPDQRPRGRPSPRPRPAGRHCAGSVSSVPWSSSRPSWWRRW